MSRFGSRVRRVVPFGHFNTPFCCGQGHLAPAAQAGMPSGRPAGSKDSGLRKKCGTPSAKASQNQAQGIAKAKSKKIRASADAAGAAVMRAFVAGAAGASSVATSSASSASASSPCTYPAGDQTQRRRIQPRAHNATSNYAPYADQHEHTVCTYLVDDG